LYVENEVAKRLSREIENYERNRLNKSQEDDILDSQMLDDFMKGRENF